MNWIKVSDQLPNSGDIVLICWKTDDSTWYKYPTNLQLAEFKVVDKFRSYFRDKHDLDELNGNQIEYWMLIPKSPEDV